MMSEMWLGSVVSIDCGDVLGTYQGKISHVDKEVQTITLVDPFRNGNRHEFPQITVDAVDIQNLKIIETNPGCGKNALGSSKNKLLCNAKTGHQGVSVAPSSHHAEQPSAHMNDHVQTGSPIKNCKSAPTNGFKHSHTNGVHHRSSHHANPVKEEPFRKRTNSASECKERRKVNQSTPRKIENRRRTPRDDWSSAPVDSYLDDEFDFEKNLALFDKQAVFEEIENSGYTTVVKANDRHPAKYRYDENVLQSAPVVYRQIKVPITSPKDYVTDDGLIVPTIPVDLRENILATAARCGLSTPRQIEMAGRATSEMVLQLIGGSHRLTPKNAHQRPNVVVLGGPHRQGAQAVNCARQLSTHGVKVTLFVPNFIKVMPELQEELQLFELTTGTRSSQTKNLPKFPVDMIVNALDNSEKSPLPDQSWYATVVDWANQSKAPVLALDPPITGGGIDTKWSIGVCLPLALSERCGKMYLCDIGIPKKVFQELGIKYMSPFGHKFVVPLHESTATNLSNSS